MLFGLFNFDSKAAIEADQRNFPPVPVAEFLAQREREAGVVTESVVPASVPAPSVGSVSGVRPEDQFINAVWQEVPAARLVVLADLSSGLPMAGYSADPSLDLELQVAYHTAILQQETEAFRLLGAPVAAPEELLFVSDDEWHLLLTQGEFATFVIARKSDTNLALVRRAVQRSWYLLVG